MVTWHDIGVALALFLVLEGVLPFLSPGGFRSALQAISQMGDSQLRFVGITSMLLGVALLYLVNA